MRIMPKAFHVQVVEPLPLSDAPPAQPKPPIDFVKLAVITKNVTRNMAVTGGVLYGAKKLIDVTGEVALIVAKSKFK